MIILNCRSLFANVVYHNYHKVLSVLFDSTQLFLSGLGRSHPNSVDIPNVCHLCEFGLRSLPSLDHWSRSSVSPRSRSSASVKVGVPAKDTSIRILGLKQEGGELFLNVFRKL